MDLLEILSPAAVLPDLKASCKRQAFQTIAEELLPTIHAQDGGADITADDILHTLLEREKLGSTAVGQGIAIPHGRLDGLSSMVGGFISLCEPIDFDATDAQGVDLMFVLLAPTKAGAEHLNALAKIARIMREEETAKRLRTANQATDILDILESTTAQSSAA